MIQLDFIHIAAYFLNCVAENQNVIHIPERKHFKDFYHIELNFSDSLSEYYDPKKNLGRLFKPTKLPMICPPADWTNNLDGGGYLFQKSKTLINVKSKKHTDQILEALKHTSNEKIFLSAANTLQRTAWTINKAILTILDHFHSSQESTRSYS